VKQQWWNQPRLEPNCAWELDWLSKMFSRRWAPSDTLGAHAEMGKRGGLTALMRLHRQSVRPVLGFLAVEANLRGFRLPTDNAEWDCFRTLSV
jgi:hypothetical protein